MKQISEAMRKSLELRIEDRVNKKDSEGVLKQFWIEYFYSPELDFAKLFLKPQNTDLFKAFEEAVDNLPEDESILAAAIAFSRPKGPILLLVPSRLYWLDRVWPRFDITSGHVIVELEAFLREAPPVSVW